MAMTQPLRVQRKPEYGVAMMNTGHETEEVDGLLVGHRDWLVRWDDGTTTVMSTPVFRQNVVPSSKQSASGTVESTSADLSQATVVKIKGQHGPT